MIKQKKGLIILISFILILFVISNTVFGTLIDEFESSISIEAKDRESLRVELAPILGMIKIVGTIIAVAMLMVLGIKYMLGSAEQKAEYKKTMLPYIIGCVLLFGATNIADMSYQTITALGKPGKTVEEKLSEELRNGEKLVSEFSDEELKVLYNYYTVAQYKEEFLEYSRGDVELAEKYFFESVGGVTVDIYKECKARGLLDENRVYLKK